MTLYQKRKEQNTSVHEYILSYDCYINVDLVTVSRIFFWHTIELCFVRFCVESFVHHSFFFNDKVQFYTYDKWRMLFSTFQVRWRVRQSINVCITIVAFISIRELPTDDILVNINKGYSLQRIGAYLTNMVEQIVHTFVSLDSFCAAQTTDAVCEYTSSSTKINIIELASVITSHHTKGTPSTHDKESVSKSIAKDLSHVLLEHKPNEFLQGTESNVHFVNNQFHYQKNDDKALKSTSSMSTVDNSNEIIRFHPTSADIIIKQINNNRIGFEHLSPTDLKLLLTIVFSNIDDSYKIDNVEDSLNAFSQLVIGQCVYALRYCALSRQDFVIFKAMSSNFNAIHTNSNKYSLNLFGLSFASFTNSCWWW